MLTKTNKIWLVVAVLVICAGPAFGDILIPSDTSVGTWDGSTYTLTQDVHQTLGIMEGNLTLDGAGHSITPPTPDGDLDFGVYVSGVATGVTVKNLTIQAFPLQLREINYGIYVDFGSDNNLLTDSIISDCDIGVYLFPSNNNTIIGNTISNSFTVGLYIWGDNNQVYNNDFIENKTQVVVAGGIGNVFNLALPVGGNHWNDWTDPDYNGDGIVDLPYSFMGGQDNLPWVAPLNKPNTPPELGEITAPLDPVQVGALVEAFASFLDPDVGDTHIAVWDWGDNTIPSDGDVDEINQEVTGSHVYIAPGVYTITLTLEDAAGELAEAIFQYVVVYDPSAGYVTGSGWIWSPLGAYTLQPSLTGKAHFGFVAKYKKGTTTPTGKTQFKFHAGNLKFRSNSYQWLVIAGARARFKGDGTINGTGNYNFLLTGVDGQIPGGGGVDKFRIKITDSIGIVYDNKLGADDEAEPTILSSGSIVIHKN